MSIDTDIDTDTDTEASVEEDDQVEDREPTPRRRIAWSRVVAFGLLPTIALLLALGAGYAKWRAASVGDAQTAGAVALQAAKEGTVAMLSYRPDTVENDLTAARDRLTGAFRDSYTSLTDDVVIPGARQKLITAVATVPAAGVVSSTSDHAVVLVFVDQTTTIGSDAPSGTTSSVRVTLDRTDGRWLISGFDPV